MDPTPSATAKATEAGHIKEIASGLGATDVRKPSGGVSVARFPVPPWAWSCKPQRSPAVADGSEEDSCPQAAHGTTADAAAPPPANAFLEVFREGVLMESIDLRNDPPPCATLNARTSSGAAKTSETATFSGGRGEEVNYDKGRDPGNGSVNPRATSSPRSYWVLGSSVSLCDVHCAHPSISKQHCLLQLGWAPISDAPEQHSDAGSSCSDSDGDGLDGEKKKLLRVSRRPSFVHLYDLGSTNGTFVIGRSERIPQGQFFPLRDGSMFRLGQSCRIYTAKISGMAVRGGRKRAREDNSTTQKRMNKREKHSPPPSSSGDQDDESLDADNEEGPLGTVDSTTRRRHPTDRDSRATDSEEEYDDEEEHGQGTSNHVRTSYRSYVKHVADVQSTNWRTETLDDMAIENAATDARRRGGHGLSDVMLDQRRMQLFEAVKAEVEKLEASRKAGGPAISQRLAALRRELQWVEAVQLQRREDERRMGGSHGATVVRIIEIPAVVVSATNDASPQVAKGGSDESAIK